MIKILFTDDDEIVRNLYSESLQAVDGFEVETAFDGEDALQKINLSKPNLIILDINMPNKSGVEVLQALKSDPNTRDIPVIMMSGHAEMHTITECLELGAIGYIQKDEEEHEDIMAKIKLLVRLKVRN
ncbi:MAG: response regulator [Candidatus Dadabacteria bacterium]|nr:response regulator [Candidatus Dadabacteria bacterium]NIS07704.1 response regulator [Candidatus Dadabacteria bacterium]NIV42283.1 response regulator [Candidatus Dadabacteria bacterium]NIX14790.1 response regulator [Candidatus Dadabacteria bacterium]NIY21331.1 response regulator [Candidatus Dadabacteria bacterium]